MRPMRIICVCRSPRGLPKVMRELARSSVGCHACFAMPRQMAGMLIARPTLRMVSAYLSPLPISPMTFSAEMRTSLSRM